MTGPLQRGECFTQRIRAHPPLIIHVDLAQRARAEAEHSHRRMNRDVRRGADHEVDGRRAGQAVLFDVPARSAQDAMTGGGERGEVRHLTARDEADAGRARQVEEFEEPFPGDVFDDRRGGRRRVDSRVLVPTARQPVGRERDGKAAADDEPEIARAGAGDEAAIGATHERVEDGGRIFALFRQRDVQRGNELIACRPWSDMTFREAAEKNGGVLASKVEKIAHEAERTGFGSRLSGFGCRLPSTLIHRHRVALHVCSVTRAPHFDIKRVRSFLRERMTVVEVGPTLAPLRLILAWRS